MKALHLAFAVVVSTSFLREIVSTTSTPCPAVNCSVNSWSSWSPCKCDLGYRERNRTKSQAESCGGVCAPALGQRERCCCSRDCLLTNWGSWSRCNSPCGPGTTVRHRQVARVASCGGAPCADGLQQTKNCSNGCCPVTCRVSRWGRWFPKCSCGPPILQRRNRTVIQRPACGGLPCQRLLQTKVAPPCRCCPQNCTWTWNQWSACSTTCGVGRQRRSIVQLTAPLCGGSQCPTNAVEFRNCSLYDRRDCEVTAWSSYGSCVTNNGSCGVGTRVRHRNVTALPKCGGALCPKTSERVSCAAGCCPVDCAVGEWSGWTTCAALCGTGLTYQTRNVVRADSCGGSSCPVLSRSRTCGRYVPRNCVVGRWSSWSSCVVQPGSSQNRRTRKVIVSPFCGGDACPKLTETVNCTADASKNLTIKGAQWSNWGPCLNTCPTGTSYRQRFSAVLACRETCDIQFVKEQESRPCGHVNRSCEHTCSDGVCSCRRGYLLNDDGTTCRRRDCGTPTSASTYCPNGTAATACRNTTILCRNGTTYGSLCTLQCPNGYHLTNGPNSITCQSFGLWTAYQTSYCLKDNCSCAGSPDGLRCVFPFSFHGDTYNECTSVDHKRSWCATRSGDFERHKDWGECFNCSCRSKSSCFCADSVNGSRCAFPFVYQGIKYWECTAADHDQPWCATKPGNYSEHKKWGNCVHCPCSSACPTACSESFENWHAFNCSNCNEPPNKIFLSSESVYENVAIGSTVGTLATRDPNQFDNDSHIYSLLNDAGGKFDINGNALLIDFSPDYETPPNGYVIVVRSTDSHGLYLDAAFDISVEDVNEKPTKISLSNFYVDEHSPRGTPIGSFSTADPDRGQSHTYSLLSDLGNRFQVSGNVLEVGLSSLDYEERNSFTVRIRSEDSGSPPLYVDTSFTIYLRDVNDRPEYVTFSGRDTLREDAVVGTTIGNVSASDKDANQMVTCTLLADDKFAIESGTRVVLKTAVDYEQEANHPIEVRCSDDGVPPMYIDGQYVINILDVNEAPTSVGLTSYSVSENRGAGTLVGTITSVDPDNEVAWTQNVTYSVVDSGSASAPFVVDGTDLVTTSKLNYEAKSSYVINLTATDTGNPPANTTVQLQINVKDADDPVKRVSLSSKSVRENSPGGTVIGQFTVKDEDGSQDRIFLLSPDGIFYIDERNRLRVFPGAELDFETASSWSVLVRASNRAYKFFRVRVLDVNEPPSLISKRLRIAENSSPGTRVGQLRVTDEDVGQHSSCGLLNATAYFILEQVDSQLLIRVADHADIDYESSPSIRVNVECFDDGQPSLSTSRVFVVEVTDVNEPVTDIIVTGSRQLRADTPPGAVIANLTAVDEDRGQTHDFSLRGLVASAFKIVANRELILAQQLEFNAESVENISISIFVIDSGEPPSNLSRTVVFTIINDNVAPVNVTVREGTDVYENSTVGHLIGTLISFDRDNDDGPITYYHLLSVDGVAQSTEFYVVTAETTSFLYLNKTLNYDDESSFILEISVTDQSRPLASSSTSFVEINVLRTDPCALGTARCHGNAMCIRVNSTTGRCECDDGFDGDGVVACDGIDHCNATIETWESGLTLCNKGTCVDGVEEYHCECFPGYLPPDCSVIASECASNPCGRAGTCRDRVTDFECLCSPGYAGDVCSFPTRVCQNKPCADVCVPNAINGAFVNSTIENLLNNFDGGDNALDYACVSSEYVVNVSFSARMGAGERSFQNRFERYVRDNLLIRNGTISSGVSAVYVVDSSSLADGDIRLRFVVLINNGPIEARLVLTGLNGECESGSMERKFGHDIEKTCKLIGVFLNGTDDLIFSKPVSSNGGVGVGVISAVVVSTVALIAIAVVTTVLCLKRRSSLPFSTMENEKEKSESGHVNPVFIGLHELKDT